MMIFDLGCERVAHGEGSKGPARGVKGSSQGGQKVRPGGQKVDLEAKSPFLGGPKKSISEGSPRGKKSILMKNHDFVK